MIRFLAILMTAFFVVPEMARADPPFVSTLRVKNETPYDLWIHVALGPWKKDPHYKVHRVAAGATRDLPIRAGENSMTPDAIIGDMEAIQRLETRKINVRDGDVYLLKLFPSDVPRPR